MYRSVCVKPPLVQHCWVAALRYVVLMPWCRIPRSLLHRFIFCTLQIDGGLLLSPCFLSLSIRLSPSRSLFLSFLPRGSKWMFSVFIDRLLQNVLWPNFLKMTSSLPPAEEFSFTFSQAAWSSDLRLVYSSLFLPLCKVSDFPDGRNGTERNPNSAVF